MICRVAESCFWMHRYLERADNMARLIEVNFAFVLDSAVETPQRWLPLIVVAGQEESFIARFGAAASCSSEQVQSYLVWDEENPVSIISSARWARENARTIRDTISLDVWEALNGFWLWLSKGEAEQMYEEAPREFLVRVRENVQLVRGVTADTVAHDEPYVFMCLGGWLERANQIARVLDIRYHSLQETPGDRAGDFARSMALLRSLGATETFFKRGEPLGAREIVSFLALDRTFPRSISFCLERARENLAVLTSLGTQSGESERLLNELISEIDQRLRRARTNVHHDLTLVVDSVHRICNAIHQDWFDPPSMRASANGEMERAE